MSERLTIYELVLLNEFGAVVDYVHFSTECTKVRILHHLQLNDAPLITEFWAAILQMKWERGADWAMRGTFRASQNPQGKPTASLIIRPAKTLRAMA